MSKEFNEVVEDTLACKKAIGRCVYCEDNGTCTLICGIGRPKGPALCDIEDVSEPIKFDPEEFKKFLISFANAIKQEEEELNNEFRRKK